MIPSRSSAVGGVRRFLGIRLRIIGGPFEERGAFAFFRLTIYDSRPLAALLFCQCGSDRVDIANWNVARARIKCFTCGP